MMKFKICMSITKFAYFVRVFVCVCVIIVTLLANLSLYNTKRDIFYVCNVSVPIIRVFYNFVSNL